MKKLGEENPEMEKWRKNNNHGSVLFFAWGGGVGRLFCKIYIPIKFRTGVEAEIGEPFKLK